MKVFRLCIAYGKSSSCVNKVLYFYTFSNVYYEMSDREAQVRLLEVSYVLWRLKDALTSMVYLWVVTPVIPQN